MKRSDFNVNIEITLRCNGNCRNCIKFCGRGDITGLDYSDSDMTLRQIEHFAQEIEAFDTPGFLRYLNITGGEPLLHPELEKIMERMESLRQQGYVDRLVINSNLIADAPPKLQPYIINHSRMAEKPNLHWLVFWHPSEFDEGRCVGYKNCAWSQKDYVILNYQGYSICCMSDGYIRLFGMEDLIADRFPQEFDAKGMDKLCAHCPIGSGRLTPMEKDMGCPVSAIYAAEGEKNRAGRKIRKRYEERTK